MWHRIKLGYPSLLMSWLTHQPASSAVPSTADYLSGLLSVIRAIVFHSLLWYPTRCFPYHSAMKTKQNITLQPSFLRCMPCSTSDIDFVLCCRLRLTLQVQSLQSIINELHVKSLGPTGGKQTVKSNSKVSCECAEMLLLSPLDLFLAPDTSMPQPASCHEALLAVVPRPLHWHHFAAKTERNCSGRGSALWHCRSTTSTGSVPTSGCQHALAKLPLRALASCGTPTPVLPSSCHHKTGP